MSSELLVTDLLVRLKPFHTHTHTHTHTHRDSKATIPRLTSRTYLCIYVKDVFKVTPVNVDTERPDGVEDVWVAARCRMLPTVIVGCLYRHPNSLARIFYYISDVLQVISLRDKPFYVFGDSNDNFLHVNSKVEQILLNTTLTQLIDKPTRITATSATLLDMAITNKSKSIMHSDTIPCHAGDHELIILTIDLKKPKRQPCVTTFRQLTNYSPETFCSLLREEVHNFNKNIYNRQCRYTSPCI